MKTLMLLPMLLIPVLLSAQNTVSVLSSNVLQGNDLYIEIDIENQDEIVAFQMDIHYPPEWELIDYKLDRGVDHIVNCTQVDQGVVRVLAYSMTNKAFLHNKGVVLGIRLKGDNIGKHKVALTGVMLSDRFGNPVDVETDNGYITIHTGRARRYGTITAAVAIISVLTIITLNRKR